MTKHKDINENRVGYEKTKLGWIPEEWKVKPFNEVFSFGKSVSLSRALLTNEDVESKIFCIHYGDIHSKFKGEFIDFKKNDIPKIRDNSKILKNPFYLQNGDLIMADASEDYEGVGSCLEIKNIGKEKAVGGLHTFVIRDINNKTANGFRSYIFKDFRVAKSLKKIATGISVYGISKTNLAKVLLPLPPLPEQEKIAKILSTWDKAITETQDLIQQLQIRKKGLMQQLLTGKKRLDGFSGEWEKVTLGDLIKERKEYPKSELPLYSLTIENGVVPKSKRYERSFLLKTKVDAYKQMCPNDFALNPMNLRFGAIAKYKGNKNICVSKYYNIFHCNDHCDSNFIEYYLTSYNMIQYYNKMAIGTLEEKKRVHYSDFVKFKKLLPTKKEQTAIAQVLNQADQEIKNHESRLLQLEEQKKGLMQQLLTGTIRVNC